MASSGTTLTTLMSFVETNDIGLNDRSVVQKTRMELRKEVALAWLHAIDDCKEKDEIVVTDKDYAKYHKLLHNLPEDLPITLQELARTILSSEGVVHRYRVVYIGIFIGHFFKGFSLPISLAGSWEDEERLGGIMVEFLA